MNVTPAPAAAAPAAGSDQHGQTATAALVPFVRGSVRHVEPVTLDKSLTFTSSAQLVQLAELPAFGFVRSILLTVEVTGGTGTAAVYKEDAPWSIIQSFTLLDTNGAALVELSGYELFLAHLVSGTVANADPTQHPHYVTPSTAGNFTFTLRVPIEISPRDALGALPQMNAAQPYQFRLVMAQKEDVYSTDPTGMPTAVRWTAELEAWSKPAAVDIVGRPVASEPPAIQTNQFWTRTQIGINSGQFVARWPRMGNVLRNVVCVFRNGSGVRTSSAFPDPTTLALDSNQLVVQRRRTQPMYFVERTPSLSAACRAMLNGVVVFDFTSDWNGALGFEMRDQWLPTTGATRLELTGSWGTSGTLTVMTNDVSLKGNPYVD